MKKIEYQFMCLGYTKDGKSVSCPKNRKTRFEVRIEPSGAFPNPAKIHRIGWHNAIQCSACYRKERRCARD